MLIDHQLFFVINPNAENGNNGVPSRQKEDYRAIRFRGEDFRKTVADLDFFVSFCVKTKRK
jgi:hypothetical protein